MTGNGEESVYFCLNDTVYYAESISYAEAIPDVVVPSDGPHLFLLLNVEIMGRALVDDRAETSDLGNGRQSTSTYLRRAP